MPVGQPDEADERPDAGVLQRTSADPEAHEAAIGRHASGALSATIVPVAEIVT